MAEGDARTAETDRTWTDGRGSAAYNEANPGYGFTGDPLRPIEGKYYGYLIHAGSY